ncbi:MAG: TlpA family protein disulfide reductase [Deltaproteobacteria bacterium]|nr:TlpA family protein disulfide reductase [Deltaproteobacteria bacterium]
MRRAAVVLALAGCVIAPAMPGPAPTPAIDPARARGQALLTSVLASPDLDGRPLAADARGTATVVVVFASWCPHCKDEIAILDGLRARHPGLRVLGVNYRGHEEYDGRGDALAVRAYVRDHAPWMPVVPADDALYAQLGRPSKIPTIYVWDRGGDLVEIYDRRVRALPTAAELDALLARLGA